MEPVPQRDPDEESLTANEDDQPATADKGCCSCSPQRLVCISHTFSAWGDRMWEFAVALYLVELTPGSLRLTAVFQLVRTLCTIFLGPFVGNWVDGNPRLKVARLSLVVQNIAVATSALLLLLILSVNLSKALFIIVVSLVVIVACLSVLAGIATKISIEKDWIVVICGSDKALLAGNNAILRRIDLVCKLLAPVLVGQIMTYVSKKAGVILIAAWNLVSVFFEYYMLLRVFKAVPALSIKKIDKERHRETTESSSSAQEQASREHLDWMERENGSQENVDQDTDALVPQTGVRVQKSKKPSVFQRIVTKAKTMKVGFQIYMRQTVVLPGLSLACLYFTVLSFGSITTGYIYTQNITESVLSILRGAGSVFGILATFVFPLMRNSIGVVRSGLFSMSAQFACMVVCLIAIFTPGSPFLLLPDSIRFHGSTVITHHIHNSSVGNCSVLPTPSIAVNNYFFDHQYANQLMENNGTVGNSSTSVFGTKPIETSYFSRNSSPVPSVYSPVSSIQVFSTLHPSLTTPQMQKSSILSSPTSSLISSSSWSPRSSVIPSPSLTTAILPSPSVQPRTKNCTVDEVTKKKVTYNFSYVSVSLMIAGIILSRFGLWLSDLCITQLQQENVPEEERGIVGAMQKAFNSILDMSMYVFVIALPKPEEFGFMALMSVGAVGFGGLMYARFAYKSRGHLFHFDKIKRVLVRAGSDRAQPSTSAHRTPSREILNPEDEEEDEMLNEVLSTRNDNFRN